MSELISECLVPIFTMASTVAMISAVVAKGVNILIKSFTRGELVV